MASVNKVIIVGNLGRDPEMKYLPSGEALANIAVATSDSWTDKASGEKKEQTEWHRITMFGKLAEIAGQYLKKGSQVYVEGSLKTRKYTDKDGVEKYATEIRANVMQMLDRKPQGQGNDGYARDEQQDYQRGTGGNARPAPQQQRPPQQQRQPASAASGAAYDDDIPFIGTYSRQYMHAM